MAYVPDYRVVNATFNRDSEESTYLDFFRTTKIRSQQLIDSIHKPESSDIAARSDYQALTLKYPNFRGGIDTDLLGVTADAIRSVCNEDAPAIAFDTLKKYTDGRLGGKLTGARYVRGFASTINLLPAPGGAAVLQPVTQGDVLVFDLLAGEAISINTFYNERIAINCGVDMNVVIDRGAVNPVRYTLTSGVKDLLVTAIRNCRVVMRSSLPIYVDSNVSTTLAEDGFQLFMLDNNFTDGTVMFMTLAEYVTNLISQNIKLIAPGLLYQAFESYILLSNALSAS
jgi:hypothetical protein